MAQPYDLVLLGNAGRNTMHKPDGTVEPIMGGPLFHSALATTWSDRRVAVVTRMSPTDRDLLSPLEHAGIAVHVSPATQTTRSHIFYNSDDVDDRRHLLEASAGSFSWSDIPAIDAALFHLVGVNRVEFPLKFMVKLHERKQAFSVDMQALIRRAEPSTGDVAYEDYPHKREVASMAHTLKMDAVEAGLLTGTQDFEEAAARFEAWGAREIMITRKDGAFVRRLGCDHFEPFTNRDDVGRTGRGDSVFASYLLRRMDCGVAEALRFAVALGSIKMESPGLFRTDLGQVLARMQA